MAIIAILTNLPDSESAFNLARMLVERRLAACVNVFGPVTSFYRWESLQEQATEVPVIIKSTTDRYTEIEHAIREAHPYSIPEIIALPVAAGLDQYLEWIESECKPPHAIPSPP